MAVLRYHMALAVRWDDRRLQCIYKLDERVEITDNTRHAIYVHIYYILTAGVRHTCMSASLDPRWRIYEVQRSH